VHRPLPLAIAAFLPVLVLAACGDDAGVDVGTGGAGGALTGVGGEGDAGDGDGGDGVTSVTSTSGSRAQGTGGGDPIDEGPYPIVLAHGFFGFEEFAGVDFITYFHGVRDDLAASGEEVTTPAVDPFNDSTFRGAQLLAHVEQVLAQTGKSKVVIVGHSQGGLDARVVAHDRPDLVAAVVTVATPHQGTPIADVLLGLVSNPFFADVLDELTRWVGGPLYDEVGEETSIAAPLRLFSQPGIQAFNAAYPDDPSVFYASIGGRSNDAAPDSECDADVAPVWMSGYASQLDPMDPLFSFAAAIVGGDGDAANDGLVRVRDSRRGEFWGCIPADHLDEVGQLFGDAPGGSNSFEHKRFYRDLVGEIRARGY
jgi:triacylglycerol lipase